MLVLKVVVCQSGCLSEWNGNKNPVSIAFLLKTLPTYGRGKWQDCQKASSGTFYLAWQICVASLKKQKQKQQQSIKQPKSKTQSRLLFQRGTPSYSGVWVWLGILEFPWFIYFGSDKPGFPITRKVKTKQSKTNFMITIPPEKRDRGDLRLVLGDCITDPGCVPGTMETEEHVRFVTLGLRDQLRICHSAVPVAVSASGAPSGPICLLWLNQCSPEGGTSQSQSWTGQWELVPRRCSQAPVTLQVPSQSSWQSLTCAPRAPVRKQPLRRDEGEEARRRVHATHPDLCPRLRDPGCDSGLLGGADSER